ncbi:MAG: L-serine ammonia-lyase, iron-sulfur-dependent subunit beta [Clostridia bacterium]|nr:L-serine ammonia-lyase, iron-sulfur-dependent subunit beta [Clostridia bacterium]
MNCSIFDIIGPRMIGPSSSHTAGAVRIGQIANKLVGSHVKKAYVTLYGSFAETGRGHGTDMAIVAGILGMDPDEGGIRYSHFTAQQMGIDIKIEFSKEEAAHPNTAKVHVVGTNGQEYTYIGTSVGGGRIEITSINDLELGFSCEYPTLIVFHEDKLGTITKVTSILAAEKINIAFMKVFRSQKSQAACMVIETDSQINESVLKKIECAAENITEVCFI